MNRTKKKTYLMTYSDAFQTSLNRASLNDEEFQKMLDIRAQLKDAGASFMVVEQDQLSILESEQALKHVMFYVQSQQSSLPVTTESWVVESNDGHSAVVVRESDGLKGRLARPDHVTTATFQEALRVDEVVMLMASAHGEAVADTA